MLDFTRDGASGVSRQNEKVEGLNLHADRNFSSVLKNCGKIIFKACRFPGQILIENKVKSCLHMIALPDFFINL